MILTNAGKNDASEIDIGLRVLDHQLLDRDGRRCGNVDDLAIEGGPGERAEVVAILVGPGYWAQRAGWIGRLAGWIGGGRTRSRQLARGRRSGLRHRANQRATELGLGRGDDRAPALHRQDPRSEPMRTLSSLLRRKVVTESGQPLGRCRDLRGELAGSRLLVTGLCVGGGGWLEHFGLRDHDQHTTIPWEAIVRIERKRIVVRDDAEER